jgi:hypothetical protein
MRYYAAAAMVVGVLLPAMKACEIVIFPFIVVGVLTRSFLRLWSR